jgi:Ca-activated chloride channel homolog
MKRLVVGVVALVLALAGCTSSGGGASGGTSSGSASGGKGGGGSAAPGVLRVLAGSELQDMAPVLEEARKATGVRVEFTWSGSLDGADQVASGTVAGRYDAVWFPSDHYLRLDGRAAGRLVSETPVMVSPVALGIGGAALRRLGWDPAKVTWAQVAEAAESGKLSYGMSDPSRSNSGFSALVAVASALSGAKSALTAQQVAAAAPALKRFFSGQRLTSGSSGWLAQAYGRRFEGGHGAPVDALVNYESVLLSLNRTVPAAGRMTVVRPVDGVVSADYPLSLLASSGQTAREDFKRLTAYLLRPDVQRRISETTLRRPVTPGASPAAALPGDRRRELPFPGSKKVADGLLGSYQNELRRPSRTVYVLDTSGSMGGDRLSRLKEALARLTGSEDARGARRFRNREEVTLMPFASEVKETVTTVVPAGSPGPALAAIRDSARKLTADGGTAVYDSLEAAFRLVAQRRQAEHDDRFTSIVVMTDGASNSGADAVAFASFYRTLGEEEQSVPVFPVLFGDSDRSQLQGIADLTGGRLFDAVSASLDGAFEEIRGYQ